MCGPQKLAGVKNLTDEERHAILLLLVHRAGSSLKLHKNTYAELVASKLKGNAGRKAKYTPEEFTTKPKDVSWLSSSLWCITQNAALLF